MNRLYFFAFPLVALSVVGCAPATPDPIRISKSTTFIVEPLDAAGKLDYFAAYKKDVAAGSTPENNLETAIREIVGPDGLDSINIDDYFSELGIPIPESPVDVGAWQPLLQRRMREIEFVWESESNPELAAWIEANESAIDRVALAAKRSMCYIPMVKAEHSIAAGADDAAVKQSMHPPLSHAYDAPMRQYKTLGRLLIVRANLRIGEGQYEPAIEDALALLRIGRLTIRNGPLMYFVGSALEDAANLLLSRALLSKRLCADACESLLACMQSLPTRASPSDALTLMRLQALDRVYYRNERRHQIVAEVMKRYEGLSSKRVTRAISEIDFQQVLIEVNQDFDQWMLCALAGQQPTNLNQKPYKNDTKTRKRTEAAVRKALGAKYSNRKKFFYDWYLQRTLRSSSPKGVPLVAVRSSASTNVIQTAFAVELHRIRTGKLPTSLDQLTQNGDSFLRDAFDGSLLKYKVTEPVWKVYAVGDDLVDDGGVFTTEWQSDPRMLDYYRPDYGVEIPR